MSESLQEIVARLALDPVNARGLTFVYQRGHDLSGIARLAVSDGTAFTLNANNPRKQRTLIFSGNLGARQSKALLTAIVANNLLEVPSSTRNIGDDEVPFVVELSFNEHKHRLAIWEDDAKLNRSFQQFADALGSLLLELFASQVGSAATTSS